MWTEAVREDIWIFADDRDRENEEKKEKKVKRIWDLKRRY